VDDVAAEVLYPTLAVVLYQVKGRELQNACFRVYNDWTAEFCSYNPRGLIGEGIRELERCAKKGLRSVMILGNPSIPYSDHAYDPFWRAAQEHNMLLALHVITGTTRLSTIVATVLGGGKGNHRRDVYGAHL
jgi:predicted TIM-barrel fold metal-dependent hydrolase